MHSWRVAFRLSLSFRGLKYKQRCWRSLISCIAKNSHVVRSFTSVCLAISRVLTDYCLILHFSAAPRRFLIVIICRCFSHALTNERTEQNERGRLRGCKAGRGRGRGRTADRMTKGASERARRDRDRQNDRTLAKWRNRPGRRTRGGLAGAWGWGWGWDWDWEGRRLGGVVRRIQSCVRTR